MPMSVAWWVLISVYERCSLLNDDSKYLKWAEKSTPLIAKKIKHQTRFASSILCIYAKLIYTQIFQIT